MLTSLHIRDLEIVELGVQFKSISRSSNDGNNITRRSISHSHNRKVKFLKTASSPRDIRSLG